MKCKEKIVLASNSPRRRELLEKADIVFEVIPPEVDEGNLKKIKKGTPEELSVLLSTEKAKDVINRYKIYNRWVLAADTMVVLENRIMGKPENKKQWKEMLEELSGRTHKVITGWCLAKGDIEKRGYKVSLVKFRKLRESEIIWYINTGEGFDKAGGYAIQGRGVVLVESIEGDWSNVVGLPLPDILKALWELKVIE